MAGRFSRSVAAAIVLAAALLAQAPARAADAAGFAPGLPSAQLMLYASWPLGARDLHATTFGLRYDRASAAYVNSTAPFPMALRHRSLVQLEFSGNASPRVLFDTRVAWDLGRGQLGPARLVGAAWRLSAADMRAPASAPELP
jgi:hypothetical protein